MSLNDHMDETSPLDDSVAAPEGPQSRSSGSSYLNIDLNNDIEDEEIDTTASGQVDQELEEVRSGIPTVTLKLHSQMICFQVDVEATEQSHSEDDLCSSIPGMYRILDLVSERGSSGLGIMAHNVSA